MQIERAYTSGSDGLQGFYGVIVFKGGKKEIVIDRSLVYSGPNVEPYWSEGNFDTREQAAAATYKRIAAIKRKVGR
jgi:hypothetical protein